MLPEEDELALRLALRVANLVSSNPVEKRKIFEFIKKAYRLRSKIVHGSVFQTDVRLSEDESLPIGQFVERLQDYLRKAILRILRTGGREQRKQFIERLANPF